MECERVRGIERGREEWEREREGGVVEGEGEGEI